METAEVTRDKKGYRILCKHLIIFISRRHIIGKMGRSHASYLPSEQVSV